MLHCLCCVDECFIHYIELFLILESLDDIKILKYFYLINIFIGFSSHVICNIMYTRTVTTSDFHYLIVTARIIHSNYIVVISVGNIWLKIGRQRNNLTIILQKCTWKQLIDAFCRLECFFFFLQNPKLPHWWANFFGVSRFHLSSPVCFSVAVVARQYNDFPKS